MGDEPQDLKGEIPESWFCIDCGFNTAPGCHNRTEMEKAIAAGDDLTQTIDSNSEVYTVRDRVWEQAGMKEMDGCLCIGCLEKRIGRALRPKDFQRGHPMNDNSVPGTPRLLKRRGRR